MGFFDEVKLPDGTNDGSANNGSSFFSNVTLPKNQDRADQEFELKQQAQQAEEESKKANSFGTILKATALSIPSVAWEATKNTWNTYKEFPNKAWEDIQAGADSFQKAAASKNIFDALGNVTKGVYKAGVRTAADFAIAVFAPLSSAIGATMQASGGQHLTDAAGKIIADGSGITDLPAFQKFAMSHPNFAEDFNRILTLMMAGGEKGKIEPGKIVDSINGLAKKTVEQATPVEPAAEAAPAAVPEKAPLTPSEKQAAYAKSQGYEPYTPADKLPVIDMGKPAKDVLPTIQVGESVRITKNSKGDFVYEPIKESMPPQATPAPEAQAGSPAPAPVERPVLPDGSRVAKGAADINASLIEKGMRPLTPDEQARYNPTNEPEQDTKISQLLADPEKLKSIISGSEPVPKGVVSTLLKERIAEFADKNGDTQMSMDLAKSKLSSASSEAGQSLSFSGGNKGDTTADVLSDIRKAREGTFEKTTGKKASDVMGEDVKSAKDALKKSTPSKGAWEEFINNIKCNY